MKILFITNIPSPYRVDFFNEMGKYCELVVLFEKHASSERDNSWLNYKFKHFTGIFLKGKSYKTDGAICFDVIKYLDPKVYDHIVCTNFSSPTGMMAIEYMRLRHMEYYLESDGGFPKSGRGFRERLKRHFIKGAKGYFSTGATHDNYYIAYGAPKERIHRYPFTSLKSEDLLSNMPTKEEKLIRRKELGMHEKKIVLSVGQFIPRKGFDTLIKSAKKLSDDIGFYLVGGEPLHEYLVLAEGMNNIHFVNFRCKDELKEYYMAADVFVHPTRNDIWGLVINEAMSLGLPVITTDKCIAGLELIKDGFNGYIVPVDSADAVAEKINQVIEESVENMGQNALDTIFDYTFTGMVNAHLRILTEDKRQ